MIAASRQAAEYDFRSGRKVNWPAPFSYNAYDCRMGELISEQAVKRVKEERTRKKEEFAKIQKQLLEASCKKWYVF